MNKISSSSKADFLKALEGKLTKAHVLSQVSFNVQQWQDNQSRIIKNIQESLDGPNLIIRSSSLSEDSDSESKAGLFKTVSNIEIINSDKIISSVNEVIDSYEKDSNCLKNKVLVQKQILDIETIGVAFTCELSTFSPYYIINYLEGSCSFDSITSGRSNESKTYVRFKKSPHQVSVTSLAPLIETLEELEIQFENPYLDVEFAIDSTQKLYIFQVRPIVSSKAKKPVDLSCLEEALIKIHSKIKKINTIYPYLYGNKTMLGVMPDWNPAEIIGCKPKMLALSLYKELITDSIWAYQRNNYGYKNLRSFPSIRSLMGCPYVDVRITFNSFIPKTLDDKISNKLVNYYLNELTKYPANHDKVEFNIVFSCFYLDLKNKINKLLGHGFSEYEIKHLKTALIELTNKIINPSNGPFINDLEKINVLHDRHDKILKSSLSSIDKIYWLIEDCKRYGTLPFAGIARAAFIANQLLNSFVDLGIMTKLDHEMFLSSINTITREFNSDYSLLKREMISKEVFLKKYGHLRPGTYDILSLRYDEGFEKYFDIKSPKQIHEYDNCNFSLNNGQLNEINTHLEENGLLFTADEVINFIKKAIKGREEAKFVFTKSLSDALSLLKDFAGRFNISCEDLSHLNIMKVMNLFSSVTNEDVKDIFLSDINTNKENYTITNALKLPQLISNENDIFDFYISASEPSYISLSRVTTDIVLEKNFNTESLDEKIVFIQSADPGYDWIFSKYISGLVTMFGGANSHMAIRAAELQLPAIIGAGEHNFNYWSQYKTLEIDCANKIVRIIK